MCALHALIRLNLLILILSEVGRMKPTDNFLIYVYIDVSQHIYKCR